MADVYGTQEVAVKIVAWLDKDTFDESDAFVEKFADELQDKLGDRLKKQKIKVSDIIDSKNVGDSVAKSAAAAGQKVVDSIKKATAGVDAGKLFDFTGAAKYVDTSGIQRDVEKLQAEFKLLLQMYEEIREKQPTGVMSAKDETRLWRQGDKIRKMSESLRKEFDNPAVAGALGNYASKIEMVNEQVTMLLGNKPVPPDFINMNDAERQLAVIQSLKDEYEAWTNSYSGTSDDDKAGLRIAERLKKAYAAYDKLIDSQRTFTEEQKDIESGNLPDFLSMTEAERLEYRLNMVVEAMDRVKNQDMDSDRKKRELLRLANEYDAVTRKIEKLNAVTKAGNDQQELNNAVERATNILNRGETYEGFNGIFSDSDFDRDAGLVEKKALTVKGVMNGLKKAFHGATDWFRLPSGAFSKQADAIRAKINSVKKKMDELARKKIPTDAYKDMVRAYKETENALKRLIERKNNMDAKGVDPLSTNYRNLASNIENSTDKLRGLQDTMRSMQSDGTATISGAETSNFAMLKEQLAVYEARLKRVASVGRSILSGTLSMLGSIVGGTFSIAMKAAGKTASWLFKHIKNGAKSTVKFFGSMIKSIAGIGKHSTSAADTVKQAFNTMFSYIRMFRTRIRRRIVSEMFDNMMTDFGQMAKISQDFNTSVSSMVNTLRMLGAQILAITEPLITTFAPVISYIGDLAAKVADTLSQFTSRLTGSQTYIKASKGNYDFAKSMENSETKTKKATKAVKEYKNTVLSFDELHKLNDVDDNESNLDEIDNNPKNNNNTNAQLQKAKTDATELNKIADRIFDAFKRHDYKGAGQAMADAVNAGFSWLKDTFGWKANGEKITKTLGNVTDVVNGFIEGWHSIDIGRAIGDVFNTIVHSADILTDPETGIKFKEAGLKLGETLGAAFAEIDWSTAGKAVMNGVQGLIKFVTGLVTAKWTDENGIEHTFGSELGKAIHDSIMGAKDAFNPNDWADFITGIINSFADMLDAAFSNPDEYAEFGDKIGEALSIAFAKDSNGEYINIDQKKLKSGINKALSSIGGLIHEAVNDNQLEDVGGFFGDLLFGKGGITEGVIKKAYEVGLALGTGIFNGLSEVVKKPVDAILDFDGLGLKPRSIADGFLGMLGHTGTFMHYVFGGFDDDKTYVQMQAYMNQATKTEVQTGKIAANWKDMRDVMIKCHGITGQMLDQLSMFYEKLTGSGEGFANEVDKGMAYVWRGATQSEIHDYFTPKYGEDVARDIELANNEDWEGLGKRLAETGRTVEETVGIVQGLIKMGGDTAVNLVTDSYEKAKAAMETGNIDTKTAIDTTCNDVTAKVEETTNGIVDMAEDANNKIGETDWEGTGRSITDGLGAGVEANKASFINAMNHVAVDAFNTLIKFFRIGSPSKLMSEEIGRRLPEGLAVGVDAHADVLLNSMESLGDMTVGVARNMTDDTAYSGGDGILQGAILSGMRQAVMEAAMTMQSGNDAGGGDIVLMVDSEELARASARGQRRIDKRTSPMITFG